LKFHIFPKDPSPSPRYASGRYFQQPWGIRFQRHQREAIDDQVKSTKWRNPRGNPPLFLVTLIRKVKSQEIFNLNSLNNIILEVESYRAQTGLTQCYNCQNSGHVWANCKLPPLCLCFSGGHLHRECPEKMNTKSTPSCCNCPLVLV
jgi:hypothetical protein